MRVLGIDPGLAITGYGVVEETDDESFHALAFDAIVTPAGTPTPERLARLYASLCDVIAEYQPDVMAVERLFFGRNVSTAFVVGQARGVILLCAAQNNIPVAEYKPAEIKLSLVGYGNAAKQQVQFMVQSLLHLPQIPRPDDVADALATAICHIFNARLARLVREGDP